MRHRIRVVAEADDHLRRVLNGWRASASLRTDAVLDALEPAIHDRGGATLAGPVHHGDRMTQCLSMRYTDRLADAGSARSVGSCCDSYRNGLAESVIGRCKTEVIQRRGPWRHDQTLEFATLIWVDWFNTLRLVEPLACVLPAEYDARSDEQAKAA
jgi:putative transposase